MKKSNIALVFVGFIAVLLALSGKSHFQLYALNMSTVTLIVSFVIIALVLMVVRKKSGKLLTKESVAVILFVIFMTWLLNFS